MGKGSKRAGGGPTDRFSGSRSRREQIKDAQLCAAVEETLSLVLAQSSSELLLSAYVMGVVPAPDASRLLVQIEVGPEVDPEAVHAALTRSMPELRAEIAASVSRKRTPTLVFEVRRAVLPE